MKLELQYKIDCSTKQFWKQYFDAEFTKKMHLEALGSTSFDLVAQSGDTTGGLHRTLRYGQKPDMPGPVKKLFGTEVITTEVGEFDPGTGTWTFQLTPGTLAEKTEIRGTIRLDGKPASKTCNQLFTLEAKVRIFGVGPIVEKFIEAQARQTQERAAAFINSQLSAK